MHHRITYIGTATVLLEIGSLRLLTDPAFDPAGTTYALEPAPGLTIGAHKLAGPAVRAESVGPIDAVLLSHDEHFDNLDERGRELLADAARVITTPAGAGRLADHAVGLAPWESLRLTGTPDVVVTATPARHGPEGTESIIGDTTGFVLEWAGQAGGVLYISGDTVMFDGLLEVGTRFTVGTAVLHLGAGGFDASGDMRFTLDAAQGAALALDLGAHTVIPVHYDGWSHFTEPAAVARTVLGAQLGERVLWLDPGVPCDL